MTSNDQRISVVPSLMKWSYHACNKVQRNKYNGMDVPVVDLRDCCKSVFQFIKLNRNKFNDPQNNRPFSMVHFSTRKKLLKIIINKAPLYGHVDCLSFALEIKVPWFLHPWLKADEACAQAASRGHLECLKYADEMGCRWDSETCEKAAEGGHLNCLRYAHENGCPWSYKTCEKAAGSGHLDCLKYAHENGCLWDSSTCAKAAEGGHVDCLRYALENGCPQDSET
ncbi:uncharacterized protein LOC114122853 [Aphis gossypii]|nr:uncharacterized protein LOC114122853 [Aphis gossypii]